jgi:glycosyltransferase involved in cell wall biosynthesis
MNQGDTPLCQRSIRIGILGTQGIPARYGGFETFAEELATRWAEDEAFEITVVCPGPRRPDQPESLGRIRLVYVPEPRLGPFTNVAFDLRCLWDHRHSFDILYMLGFGAAFACALPRLWGTRVWINMDGLEWKRSKWGPLTRGYVRIMERISTWSANRLIADAEAIRQYFFETYGRGLACTFIPYGAHPLDPATYPAGLLPDGLESGGYHLVVARLEPENQVLEIVEGYLRSAAVHPLVVVGGIQNPNGYVQRLLALASDRVRFLGGVYDKPRLAALRCHARSYFHGHTVGGTNPSLLEAISAGRPIIAHDNPFNREVAGDLATFFDSSEAIRRILDGETFLPESMTSYRKACETHMEAKYTWPDVTEAYKRLARSDFKS